MGLRTNPPRLSVRKWITVLFGCCKPRRRVLDKYDLREILAYIMATQAEIVSQLNATSAKLDKIAGETQSLIDKINELLTIIANTPNASPELVAAAESVRIKTDTVDLLVEDLPTPPAPKS